MGRNFLNRLLVYATMLLLAVAILPATPATAAVDCSVPPGPGVNLSGCVLHFSRRPGVNLSGANLRGTDLFGSDLTGANLRGIALFGADLREANLASVELSFANLTDANLTGTDHTEAFWGDTTYPNGSNSDTNELGACTP